MRDILFPLIVVFSGQLFGQSIFDDYKRKTDSLNLYFLSKLKDNGKLDSKGLKVGFWTEYNLFIDSANNAIPITIKGEDFSLDLEFNAPTKLYKSEGQYSDGQKMYQWNYYNATYSTDTLKWELVKETYFIGGIKNGLEKEYSNGNIYREAWYLDNELNGIETFYFFQGVTKLIWIKGTNKKGLLYYPNGILKMKEVVKKNSITNIIEYHENGRCKAKYSVLGQDENRKFYGTYKSYDEYGQLVEKMKFSNDLER